MSSSHRSVPISNLTFPTATETVTTVRFNMSEPSVLASTGSDRTFTLYDIRTAKAERRVVMHMQSNALSWCPTFPTSLLLASEDHNLYTFDIRHLSAPSQIYKAHVAAVMSCDWSPTGLEFVSAGWDRTVRIWSADRGHSPEVYHTKRMQRVLSTAFSADARFVLSGSDDGNVRIWKAHASEKLGVVTARERAAIEYRNKLVERWKNDRQVGSVSRFVSSSPCRLLSFFPPDTVIYQNQSTRPPHSNEPCSKPVVSRRNADESTPAPETASPKPSARQLLSPSKPNVGIFSNYYIDLFVHAICPKVNDTLVELYYF
jgi:WD40 repeat protein